MILARLCRNTNTTTVNTARCHLRCFRTHHIGSPKPRTPHLSTAAASLYGISTTTVRPSLLPRLSLVSSNNLKNAIKPIQLRSLMIPAAADQKFTEVDASSAHAYKYFENVEKPDTDDRSYRVLELPNKLQVLVIHDSTTDKASAALDVNVGHLSDPLELQGLAHFCEHLLFMGTDKYPKENEYSQFLSDHSGNSNAYTAMESTNYYFEVGYKHLEGALDRFAQFFICPRFDPSCTDRELRAVDSENKKNLQIDHWRLFQLEKSLSRPEHPYSKFGTGSLETLKESPEKLGLDIREELLKFHDRYYSANAMRLVVLGRESLDELTASVVDKFTPIVNKNVEVPTWPGSPWGKEQLLKKVLVRPIKDQRKLEIAWPFPDQDHLFASQPQRYLGHLLGHEGPGSILSLLKKKGWANSLGAGVSGGGKGFDFFKLSFSLTEEGLTHYEHIVCIVFKYLELLKTKGVKESIFQEVKDLSLMSFKFEEKMAASSYTSALSGQMQFPYPPEWILSGNSVVREYRPDLIAESLRHLNADSFRLTVVSQSFPSDGMSKERWYKTEHKVEPISDGLKSKLRDIANGKTTTDTELTLPGPNAFIATNFDLSKIEVAKRQERPDLLLSTPLANVWHKKDDTFWVPKANIAMSLRTPMSYANPRTAVMSQLFTLLLEDSLSEYSYDAEVAGLVHSIDVQLEGLSLNLSGYNDKMGALLETILKKMQNFEVKESRFPLIKDILDRYYKNTLLDAPHSDAMYYMTYLHQEKLFTPMEKSAELESITPKDVQLHIPQLLQHMHIEALINGNVKREEALSYVKNVENILAPKALLQSELIHPRSVILPEGKQYVYQENVPDKENVNSAIEYYCAGGDVRSPRHRAVLSLLAQIAEEPCFNQLRTNEQLGYLVFSGVRKENTNIGLRFIVQSERDTVYLETRIEAFLVQLKTIIDNLEPEAFAKHVESLIHKKTERLKNLSKEARRFWLHISSGYYEFDSIDADVAELRQINKEEILDFFMKYIHPSSPTRSKVSVHLQSQKPPAIPSPVAAAAVDPAAVSSSIATCFSSRGVTANVEDIQAAIAQGGGLSNLEDAVRRLLIDEETVSQSEIESLLKEISEAIVVQSDAGASAPTPIKILTNADLPAGNEIIQDLIKFKMGCRLSNAPQPLVDPSTFAPK